MLERYWIRLLPWRQRNKAETKSAQIKFAPRLRINRQDGWANLELLLVNRSSWTVWVQKATVVLIDFDGKERTAAPIGRARYEIRRNIRPRDRLGVSLARTIYDAAGRPQGLYSYLVLTNVRYSVFNEWCNAQLQTCRVAMEELTAVSLYSARWYDKMRINGVIDFTKKVQKG